MYTFVIAANAILAHNKAPWAKHVRRYKNGYMVFATTEAFNQWKNGNVKDPRNKKYMEKRGY